MNDPMSPDPREAKLALWAQNLFRELRKRVQAAEWQAEEARLATKPDESLVLVPRFGRRQQNDIGLGDATIRFRAALDLPWDRHFDVRVFTDGIQVNAGRGPLQVEPVASNVVVIRQVER